MLLLAKRKWPLLFGFGLVGFGLFILNGCAKKTTTPDPIIIETPNLGDLTDFTDKVTISFKFYDATGEIEKVTCRFTWTAGKRMTGPCAKVPPGVYVYKLEYREQGTNVLLARASAKVDIAKNNEVVIKPVLDFNIKSNGGSQTNLTVFIAGLNGSGNSAPTAKAIVDKTTMTVGKPITLDASGSRDPNQDTLTYQWAVIGNPRGSRAMISNASRATATFVPDVRGSYTIELTVRDDGLLSDATTLSFTVGAAILNS